MNHTIGCLGARAALNLSPSFAWQKRLLPSASRKQSVVVASDGGHNSLIATQPFYISLRFLSKSRAVYTILPDFTSSSVLVCSRARLGLLYRQTGVV